MAKHSLRQFNHYVEATSKNVKENPLIPVIIVPTLQFLFHCFYLGLARVVEWLKLNFKKINAIIYQLIVEGL